MGPPLSSSGLGWANPGTSATPHTSCPLDSSQSSLPSIGCSLLAPCPTYIILPKTAHSSPNEATQHRPRQDNPTPHLAGSAGSEAPQDTVGPTGCQGTMLTQPEHPDPIPWGHSPDFYGGHGPLAWCLVYFIWIDSQLLLIMVQK